MTLELYALNLASDFVMCTAEDKNMLLQNLFRHAEKVYKLENETGFYQYEHDWAKACLVLIKHDFVFDEKSLQALDLPTDRKDLLLMLDESFKITDSGKLQCYALELLCNLCLQQNQYKEILKYAEKGIDVAAEFGLDTVEGKFKDLFNKVEDELKSQYENKFMFLMADPISLVDTTVISSPASLSKITSSRSGPKEWSPAKQVSVPGPEVMEKHVAFKKGLFGDTIMKSLRSLGKKVSVHFDACNRKMLDLLYDRSEGAKVLVLHIEEVTEEYFLVENEGFGSEKITYEEMADKNQDPEFSLGIDVLLLTGPKGELLARYFRESNIKYIVYFTIPEKKTPGYLEENQYDFLTPYWVEKFKESFITKFLVEFSTGRGDAITCLKTAKIMTVETIKHLMAQANTMYKLELSSFKAAVLQEVPMKLDFEFNPNMINIEENCVAGDSVCKLNFGSLIDCSPETWKRRETYDLPEIYIKRDADLSTIYQKLLQHRQLQLSGTKGCGKTFLVRLLERELSLRHSYPDGVRYLDIGAVKKTGQDEPSLYSLIRDVFGEDIMKNESFLANKRMLVILDGYQRVIDRDIPEPSYLLECLSKHRIHTIFITNKPQKEKEYLLFETSQLHTLQGFTPEESLACMLSLGVEHSKYFFRLTDFSVEKLLRSDTMKEVMGCPAAINLKVVRFFDRELNIKLKKEKMNSKPVLNQFISLASSSFLQDNDTSRYFLDDLEDFDQSMIQYPGVSGSFGNNSSSSNKASEKKGKKQAEGKKDEKQPKQRKKNKEKKNMF